MKLRAYCDGSITGGAWGKKGTESLPHAWSGWYVTDEAGNVLGWKSVDVGEGEWMSANVAEYVAVRSALAWIVERYAPTHVEVWSDSQLIIHQLDGSYRCLDPALRDLREACLSLITDTDIEVSFHWHRREENREADVLSKALQIWGRQPTWEEVLSKA